MKALHWGLWVVQTLVIAALLVLLAMVLSVAGMGV